jgi:hypothetical protein
MSAPPCIDRLGLLANEKPVAECFGDGLEVLRSLLPTATRGFCFSDSLQSGTRQHRVYARRLFAPVESLTI